MITTKVKMWLYIVGQMLTQIAAFTLLPEEIRMWVGLAAALVGTVYAFKDPSTGMDKAMANLTAGRPVNAK